MDSSKWCYHVHFVVFIVSDATYLRRPAFATPYELNLINYLNSLGTKYTLPENITTAEQREVLTDNPGGMLKKTMKTPPSAPPNNLSWYCKAVMP